MEGISEIETQSMNPFEGNKSIKIEEESQFTEVKKKCEEFIESSNIEKSDALSILKLQHEMEKIVLETLFHKERNIETLKHEMDILKLSNRNAEILEKTTSDLSKCQKTIQELENKVRVLEQRIESVALSQSNQIKRK